MGKQTDLAIWDRGGFETAGAWDLMALVLSGPGRVRDGQAVKIDLPAVGKTQVRWAAQLAAG